MQLAVVVADHDLLAVTLSTTPSTGDSATWPESRAVRSSMPVPTSGADGLSSGTAWRCMFEPISARLASSCSRNGISAPATRHGLLRRDVHVVDLLRRARSGTARRGAPRRSSSVERAVLVHVDVGLGDDEAVLFVGRSGVESRRSRAAATSIHLAGSLPIFSASFSSISVPASATTLPSSDLRSPRSDLADELLGVVLDLRAARAGTASR